MVDNMIKIVITNVQVCVFFFENSDYDLFIVAMSLYKQVIALMKSIYS